MFALEATTLLPLQQLVPIPSPLLLLPLLQLPLPWHSLLRSLLQLCLPPLPCQGALQRYPLRGRTKDDRRPPRQRLSCHCPPFCRSLRAADRRAAICCFAIRRGAARCDVAHSAVARCDATHCHNVHPPRALRLTANYFFSVLRKSSWCVCARQYHACAYQRYFSTYCMSYSIHQFLVYLSKIYNRKLALCSYHSSDSQKIDFELKGPIQCLSKAPWKPPF